MQIVQYIDRTPRYYERIVITNAVVSRLDDIYREEANAVFITFEDGDIRYRIDGGDPDANDGHVVADTQNLYLVDKKAVRDLRMIAVTVNVTAIVTYYV